MKFGKQTHYCPNCGKKLYDNSIVMERVQVLQCSAACREAWEIKYTKHILGKDEEDAQPKGDKCLCGGVGCNSCEPQGRG